MKRLAYSMLTLLFAASASGAESDDHRYDVFSDHTPIANQQGFQKGPAKPINRTFEKQTQPAAEKQTPPAAQAASQAPVQPVPAPSAPSANPIIPLPNYNPNEPGPGPVALPNHDPSAPKAAPVPLWQEQQRPHLIPAPGASTAITAPAGKVDMPDGPVQPALKLPGVPMDAAGIDAALSEGPITLYSAGNYRLRRGPWEKVQLIIPPGKSFELIRKVTDKKGGVWYVVRYKGKTGYVHESGITHPLAGAVRAQSGMKDLSVNEAAEIAACVTNVQDAHLVPGLQSFIEAVQDKLTNQEPARIQASVNPARPAPAAKPSSAGSEAVPLPPGRPSAADLHAAPAPGKGPAPASKPSDARDPGKKGRIANAAKNQRLAEACWKAATKYRNYAPHVCRRMKTRYPCGGSDNPYKSKGWCGAGAKECIRQATGIDLAGAGDSFVSKRDTLNKKATRLAVNSCDEAPAGAVCIYTASYHSYGHIEAKILKTDPKTGKQVYMYCSDYCSSTPVRRRHTFQGAYLP